MGQAAAAAGDSSEAGRIYLDALHLAVEVQVISLALDALTGLADLKVRAGQAERALEFIFCVLSHPSSTQEAKDRAGQLRGQLEMQLAPAQVAAARERAGTVTFDALVAELLSK